MHELIKRLDSGETLLKLPADYGVRKSTVSDTKIKRDKIQALLSAQLYNLKKKR